MNHNERTIDDFIAICLLLGNDFIPPFPGAELDSGGFQRTLNAYLATRAISPDYLVDATSASVNFPFLETMFASFLPAESGLFEKKAPRPVKLPSSKNAAPEPPSLCS